MIEKLNLSKEEIDKIEEIVKKSPPVTDYVRRYIKAYRKMLDLNEQIGV